ncbi:MAG: metal-dependent hydrolase [Thermoleophilia bacterium]|nr:metal-dependent hydrolase [Thermoleophilia bacterium]
MGLEVSHRLHVTSGSLDREATLPAIPGATRYHPPMLDRMGEQLQGALPLVAAGGLGGGIIGSKLLRLGGGGIFRGLVGAVAGALGGAGLTMGAAALVRGTGAHHAPDDASAARPGTSVAAREHVKVMTWNLHGGMGGPKEFGSSQEELDALAAAIEREHPDVVLLQEVDRFSTRSNWTDTLSELDQRLDPTSSVGASAMTTVLGRDQEVAVMTFNGFSVEDARNVVHPDPRGGGIGMRSRSLLNMGAGLVDHVFGTHHAKPLVDYQIRNTVDAMVRTPGGTSLRVLSGHYEWPNAKFDHQELEVGALARGLDAWRGPTIWGADFNVRSDSSDGADERRMMAGSGLRDTLRDATEADRVSMPGGSDNPAEAATARGGIDRIYASDHLRVTSARTVTEAGEASDHLPVVAELELAPG